MIVLKAGCMTDVHISGSLVSSLPLNNTLLI